MSTKKVEEEKAFARVVVVVRIRLTRRVLFPCLPPCIAILIQPFFSSPTVLQRSRRGGGTGLLRRQTHVPHICYEEEEEVELKRGEEETQRWMVVSLLVPRTVTPR